MTISAILISSPLPLSGEEGEGTESIEKRLERLEKGVERLEKAEEEARLRELLERADAEGEELPLPVEAPSYGKERVLQLLNPEISVNGDLIGALNSSSFMEEEEGEEEKGEEDHHEHGIETGFRISEAELGLQSPLDPYTLMNAFIGFHGTGEVDLEEFYIVWTKLLRSVTLSAGKFRQNFGTVNRWHPHAADQIDSPLVLKNYFGDHGLMGTGLSLSALFPKLWATTENLILEVTGSENEHLYPEEHYLPSFLLNLKNFYEITPSLYFEWCLTGYHGYRDGYATDPVTLAGGDFSFVYEPVQRAKYLTFEIRGEYIRSFIDTGDEIVQSGGGYTYFFLKTGIRWIWGCRLDYTADPEAPSRIEWGISPTITFWQSEFVRLRAQYSHFERNFEEHGKQGPEEVFLLQVDFAAGPHKHEKY